MPTSNNSKKDRYPGIRSFEPDDQRLFYGRTKEIDELFSLVKIKPLVVLFGKSGLGKTSLLKAGVGPLLKAQQYYPLMIRLQDTSISPEDAVLSELEPYLDKEKLGRLGNKSSNKIWETINACSFQNDNGKLSTPILIFDQFEELFNHSTNIQKQWSTQIADIIEARLPGDIRDALENIPRKQRTKEQLDWFSPPEVKIVFAIRSDRMSNLHQLRYEIPAILHNRYELSPMLATQANEAIVKPARLSDHIYATAPFAYAGTTISDILANLSNKDQEIESFQLQIVCQSIEQKVKQQQQSGERDIIIQPQDLGGERGVQNILKNYYDNQISRLGSESDQLAARKLLEEGLIADGRRIGVADAVVKSSYGISAELLDKLLESRLIRPENTRLGRTYEISHDTLVNPIMTAYDKRRLEEERIEQEKELAQRELELKKETRKRRFYAFIAVLGVALSIWGGVSSYFAWDQYKEVKEKEVMMLDAFAALELSDSISKVNLIKALESENISKINLQRALAADSLTHLALTDANFQKKVALTAEEKAIEQLRISEIRRIAILAQKEASAKNFEHAIWLGKQALNLSNPENYHELSPLLLSLSNASTSNTLYLKDFEIENILTPVYAPNTQRIVAKTEKDFWAIYNQNGKLIKELGKANRDASSGALQFSPTGDKLLMITDNNQVKLFDANGNEIGEFGKQYYEYRFNPLPIFSSNGSKLLTYPTDTTAKLWNINGALIAEIKETERITFSPNGDVLMFQESEDTYQIIDSTGQSLVTFHSENYPSLSSDGTKILRSYGTEFMVDDFDFERYLDVGFDMNFAKLDEIVFFPDNKNILNIRNNYREVQIWDSKGNLIRSIGFSDKIHNYEFSKDGKTILINYGVNPQVGMSTLLFNVKDKNEIRLEDEGMGKFLEDGEKVYTESRYFSKAKIWSNTGQPLLDVKNYSDAGYAISSTDGSKFLIKGNDGYHKLLDLKGNLILDLIDAPNDYDLRLSPDGSRILGHNRKVNKFTSWILTKSSNDLTVNNKDYYGGSFQTIFFPDSDTILTIGRMENINLWNKEGQLLKEFKSPFNASRFMKITLSPNKNQLLIKIDRDACLINLDGKLLIPSMSHDEEYISNAEFSPSGNHILTWASKGSVKLWDMSGNFIELDGHSNELRSVQFSPDGKYILTSSKDSTIKIWDLKGNIKENITTHSSPVEAAIFSRNGKSIFSYSKNSGVNSWNINKKMNTEFKGLLGKAYSISYSPDGKYILTFSNYENEEIASLWSSKGKFLKTFLEKNKPIILVENFLRIAKKVLLKTSTTLYLLNLNSDELAVYDIQDWNLSRSDFSPDGTKILNISSRGDEIKIWDLKGNLLASLGDKENPINSNYNNAIWSPDGQLIYSKTKSNAGTLWQVPNVDWLQKLNTKLFPLKEEETKKYKIK